MSDQTVSARAIEFHPWDAMAAAALAGIERRGPFQFSAETGCGGSTIVLSQISGHHTAFALEGADRTISDLRAHRDLRGDQVVFVEGETRFTLPRHSFADRLDLVLLDGPHAYPLPQLEFVYLFPQARVGGWMVLDDIQIPSVHELFRFMKLESCLVLEEVIVRTAFFRKVRECEAGPDDWQRQGLNARSVLRYSWRDRLREVIRKFAQHGPARLCRLPKSRRVRAVPDHADGSFMRRELLLKSFASSGSVDPARADPW